MNLLYIFNLNLVSFSFWIFENAKWNFREKSGSQKKTVVYAELIMFCPSVSQHAPAYII